MATPSEDGYVHLEVPLALELDAAQYDDLISSGKERLTDTASVVTKKRRLWRTGSGGTVHPDPT